MRFLEKPLFFQKKKKVTNIKRNELTENEKKKKNKAKKTMIRLIGQWPQVGSTILVLTTERKNLTYRKKRIRM